MAMTKLLALLRSTPRWQQAARDARTAPVVVHGPHEHHSNILPWRESGARVRAVKESGQGQLCVRDLERVLAEEAARGALVVGSFSAASNVTGITADTGAIAALCHRYGALACFDYAAGGPYLAIDMHPRARPGEDASKDAVFLSPHKFVGGPGTPGVLVLSTDALARLGYAPAHDVAPTVRTGPARAPPARSRPCAPS